MDTWEVWVEALFIICMAILAVTLVAGVVVWVWRMALGI